MIWGPDTQGNRWIKFICITIALVVLGIDDRCPGWFRAVLIVLATITGFLRGANFTSQPRKKAGNS